MQDIFGGMFDFNRDGHTDWGEEALGLMLPEEPERSARGKKTNGFSPEPLDPLKEKDE